MVGLTAAIVGSAVIGAGASMASASSSKKAINKATAAQQQSTAESNALTSQIYGQNTANLRPFMARGNAAGDNLNALLGLAPTAGAAQPSALAPYGATTSGPTPQSAFQTYLDSTGYKFRVGEGANALNTQYAAKGLLESGAAMKAMQRFGQNTATDFFKDYAGMLSNQQAVGLTGANALAGVGTTYSNTISANNNALAGATGNAALAKASVNNGTAGSIASSFGNALGQFGNFGGFGSSYVAPPGAGGMDMRGFQYPNGMKW